MSAFEFVRLGIPCTVQTANKSRLDNYKRDVRRAAAAVWPGDVSPLVVSARVTISYFYKSDEIDVDNLIKPILDQLNGLVYVDDLQVVRVTCQKINVRDKETDVGAATPILASGLRKKDDFLHVVVEWDGG